MQQLLQTTPADELPEPMRSMRAMIEEPAVFENTDTEFDPDFWDGAYIEGESTIEDLAYARGFGAAFDYVHDAWRGVGLRDTHAVEGLTARIGLHLEFECGFLYLDEVELTCARSPEGASARSCRDLPRIPDRDMAVIAEVCEQVPYFLVCQPDDPPPRNLAEVAERNGEG